MSNKIEIHTHSELSFLSPELQLFAQNIIEELAKEETRGKTGSTPEIINHHTAGGQKRLEELMQQCKEKKATFNPRPYKASREELIELATGMKNVPNTEQKIVDHMVKAIKQASPNTSQENIESLITANSLPKDLLDFSSLAKKLGSSDEVIEKDSRFIWFSENKTLIQMIGHDAYHLLIKSRLLGLVPFETLDKLRKLKIKVAGASAVIHLIDLLACIGAEDISWWDAGLSSPSNQGRLGRIGNLKNLGSGKASSLQNELHDFNPYAKFSGTQGKVVEPSSEKLKGDIDYDEFMKDADLVVEVIDSGAGKIGIRLHARDNYGKVKIIFLADVSDAFVGLENPVNRNHFNQDIPEKVFEEIIDQFKEISESENSREKSQKKGALNLSTAVKILGKKDFPPAHKVQFSYIAAGLIPYWSQTPISARESAAIGARLILKGIMKEDVVGKNYTSNTMSQTLMPEYTSSQLQTLDEVMRGFFG